MQENIIRSLSLTGNCIQQEGELKFAQNVQHLCFIAYFTINQRVTRTMSDISKHTIQMQINGQLLVKLISGNCDKLFKNYFLFNFGYFSFILLLELFEVMILKIQNRNFEQPCLFLSNIYAILQSISVSLCFASFFLLRTFFMILNIYKMVTFKRIFKIDSFLIINLGINYAVIKVLLYAVLVVRI